MYLERQVMVSSIVAVETAAVIVNKGHPKEIIEHWPVQQRNEIVLYVLIHSSLQRDIKWETGVEQCVALALKPACTLASEPIPELCPWDLS